MKKLTEEEVAAKMIKEMQRAGLNPDDMLRVIRLARLKYFEKKYKFSLN